MQRRRGPSHARSTILVTLLGSTVEPLTCRLQVGSDAEDLRHTGQTLAAATGATTKDLMRRLGHASPAAANRYLHTVNGRDAEIASALSALAAHGDAARLPKSIVAKH